ncbi:MAG: hypothetical protein FD130_2340 [Halothiobacillaceae bacterium]|nr:MAG: hypothetical protein FD130_2340 [Halothiobacillaceae bacterium]
MELKGKRMESSYFRTSRFFHQATHDGDKSGWFFNAREGRVFGPYRSKVEAQKELEAYIQRCVNDQDMGGRIPSAAAQSTAGDAAF